MLVSLSEKKRKRDFRFFEFRQTCEGFPFCSEVQREILGQIAARMSFGTKFELELGET